MRKLLVFYIDSGHPFTLCTPVPPPFLFSRRGDSLTAHTLLGYPLNYATVLCIVTVLCKHRNHFLSIDIIT